MMCHFLVLTEFRLYPYFACTRANTLSSPPQNKFIGIYSIIEMKHTCWEKLSADSLSMFLFVCFYCCFLINTTTELSSEGFWSPGRISVKNLFHLLFRQIKEQLFYIFSIPYTKQNCQIFTLNILC